MAPGGGLTPPRTGTSQPLVWPPPELPHVDAPFAEPFFEPEPADRRAASIAELVALEAERAMTVGASLNRVVFDLPLPTTGALLQGRTERGEQGPPPPPPPAIAALPPRYVPQGAHDETLVFESRFECGNLRRATQVATWEYDLLLRTDTNTSSHTRWFFFSVANTPGPDRPVKFNIVNMSVDGSMFNHGLRPLCWSRAASKAADGAGGWRRCAKRIYYYPNGQRRRRQALHTLTFTVAFARAGDEVHFAFSYPYSYTFLRAHLDRLVRRWRCAGAGAGAGAAAAALVLVGVARERVQASLRSRPWSNFPPFRSPRPLPPSLSSRAAQEADPTRSTRFKRRTLCRSLAGNDVDVLTITTFGGAAAALDARRGVVLSARVHPGEVGSSWLMHGMIDFLTGPSLEAKVLRDNFIFKVRRAMCRSSHVARRALCARLNVVRHVSLVS
jgi:hypothetical protein